MEWSTRIGPDEVITTRLEVRGNDVWSLASNNLYPDKTLEWTFTNTTLAGAKELCELDYQAMIALDKLAEIMGLG